MWLVYNNMDQTHHDIKPKAFKVIIVGPQAVGKSSILFRLSEAKFNTAYLSTVGIDFKTYMTQVENKHYSLQIWDTAGQEKFRALTSTYYKGSQGCVCVFDLSDDSTIERCDYYIAKALEENIPNECVYLLGNKSDVKHEKNERASELAERYKVQYAQCSAKEGKGVVEVFDSLAGKLVSKFGANASEQSTTLKPKVVIKQGRQSCCSRG